MNDDAKPKILLCATMWWPSAARLAMSFLRHGCRVSAVCPTGHPIRFVTGIESLHLYSRFGSLSSLKRAIETSQPTLIIPCDDGVVWQLHELHASHPELRSLIEASLGAKECYTTIQRRATVLAAAIELGIRVPLTKAVNSAEDLEGWCQDSPAVLKLDGTWGGEGVAIVRSHTAAVRQYRTATSAMRVGVAWKKFLISQQPLALWSWGRRKDLSVTIQQFIPGRPATIMFACWQGEVLASVTVEVLATQGETGAATVVRRVQHEEIEQAARLMARRFLLNGFHGLDFILEAGNNAAHLLELNPRATQLGHLNLPGQGDLAGVLAAKLKNLPAPQVTAEECIQEEAIAFFPQALNWNPKSAYLRAAYKDVPWGEPKLVRELVRKSWPDRQLLSRIYHAFRNKKPSNKREAVFASAEVEMAP